MTKIYLIHGWGGNPNNEGWFGWLDKECEKLEVELIIPEMPNTNFPKIEEWIGKIKEVVDLNDGAYFVGHSIGSQAIMRYLEQFSGDLKVKGLIFIAGWFNLLEASYENDEDRKIMKPWLEAHIDFEKIKKLTDNILCIFSDNDPYVPLSDSEIFKEKLGAEIIIKENEGHFNTTQEIPEILEVVKS